MLWISKPTSIIMIVILFLVMMHAYPLSFFPWFLGLVGSFLFILLVGTGWSNRSILLVSSWSFLFLGICILFYTVLSWRRFRVRSLALFLISIMSSLFIFIQLLLGNLRLRTCWIIMLVAREGPLNGNFLLSGIAIHFRKPLGSLERTWQMSPPFWLHVWSVEN